MPCYCKPCALNVCLAEYYLDIETVLLEQYKAEETAGLDPTKAGIITIQYPRLDSGSFEETVVRVFQPLLANEDIWHFIPVGNNLL